MSEEAEDTKEQVLHLIDLILKSKSLEEIKKHLLEIKDLTKNNLENM
jgi:hypothetical protein